MFKDLTPAHYEEIVPFFSHQIHRLCYYNPSAFIAWSHHLAHPVWHIENGILFIGMRFHKTPEKDYLVLPIANGRSYSPDQLTRFANQFGFTRFQYVPGDYLSMWTDDVVDRYFDIREQDGFEDYIYVTSDLSGLKGKKYSKKRNLINQFVKTFYSAGNVTLSQIDSTSDIDDCLDFLDRWNQSRDFDINGDNDAACEYRANVNALENINRLGFSGISLRINDTVQAFGIGSQLTETLGGFNFEKASPDIKGLYQFFDQQCVRRLFTDYPLINKECDMGEPGLRQAKRSYFPVDTVKSYQLFLKS